MADIEPTGENIEKLGFKRISNSDFYLQGKFVVENTSEKPSSIFVDYDSGRNWQEVIGIRLGKGFSGLSLETLASDGSAIERTVNGSGGGLLRGENPTQANFRGKSIEDQLRNAGFYQDKKDEHFFRRPVDEIEYKGEVIAWVEDGKLRNVLKPLATRVKKILGENFAIVGFRVTPGFLDEPESVLTVKNDLMQFDISSEGFGGRVIDGSQKLLRDVTESELGLYKFDVIVEKSGFKIGADNSTGLIRNLDSLAGQSISDLEKRLRPGQDSMAGFLGGNESFLEVLAEDNDFVHSLGLIHRELAVPLLYAREHYLQGKGREFNYKGRRFTIQPTAYRGMQFSPFEDKTGTNLNMTIKNENTGISLSCSGLLPDMILRYGFYEGKGTSYRLAPSQIIEVFDFLKK